MGNILDRIIANKRIEVGRQKRELGTGEIEKLIIGLPARNSFAQAILDSPTGIVAEFKRRSPSKGWIFERAAVDEVVPAYSLAGAAAISVLTDTEFFGGSAEDLCRASEITRTPLLRKDFVIDEYQIYQARLWGASAVLLIASALTVGEVKRFGRIAKNLGLDVLLEIHNESELGHINEYVDVVGVNNRNLGNFITDVRVSIDLADKIPGEFVKISESGISAPETVAELHQAGFRGFLMGENFMKTSDPGAALGRFISALL